MVLKPLCAGLLKVQPQPVRKVHLQWIQPGAWLRASCKLQCGVHATWTCTCTRMCARSVLKFR